MNRNRLFIILIFSFMTLGMFAETHQHLVRPGDTLYSLAKKYGVTVEAIQAANPIIEGTNIQIGYILEIPDVEQQKKEKRGFFASLFGKKDKNKNDETSEVNEPIEEEPDSLATEEEKRPMVLRQKRPGTSDNIVVILPFKLDGKTGDDERQQMRSVEFYEGFLLAVKEAEENGQHILIQTYDLGSKTMGEILNTSSLMDADLIIAPMDLAEVTPIAEFAKENDINLVSPFVFSQELSLENKNLIQINTSKAMLYDNLTADILSRFNGYDFVFLTDNALVSKADPYADILKAEMKAKNLPFYEFAYDNPERLAKVDSTLKIVDHNILYIPVVNHKEALQKMFPCLKCTTFDPEKGALTKGQTAILGYPEWQLYTSDFMEYYYDQNVYMFSKFYVNPFDEEVRQFFTDFHYWYAKDPMPLSPRYALLGFDVGRYFLAALRRYGRTMNEHLETFNKQTLQSIMSYRYVGEGLVNKGLYLVHFTPETKIEKYEIK